MYRTAQQNIIKETTFLSWRLRMEPKDTSEVETSCRQRIFPTEGSGGWEPGDAVKEKQTSLTRSWPDGTPCRLPISLSEEGGWRRDSSVPGSQNIFFYPVANLQGRKLKQSCFPNLGQGYFPYFGRNLLFMRRERNQRHTESKSVY